MKLHNYIQGNSQIKNFEPYEKLFNLAEINDVRFCIVPKYKDFYLKKKIILHYLELNKK